MALESRLPAIADALVPNVVAALEAGGELVVRTADELVPKDTRRLEGAIHIESDKEHVRDRLEVRVVAYSKEAFYGHMVEYGTHHVTREAKEWTTAPRPFMVPALELNRGPIRQLLKAGIGKAASVRTKVKE